MATTPFHTADALRQRIADAVCHEKIYPAYQPIVCLRTRAIHGLEVLARWHDPDFGAVPPKDLIPIALQASLLPLLTLNLVRRACAEAGTWPGRFCLAFNVPPSLLQDAPAVRLLLEAMAESSFPLDRICIEMTEDELVEDEPAAERAFGYLKSHGIRVALDDFGTGYSSLTYLKRLPAHLLKIDQGFIRDMLEDPDDIAILDALLALARSFGRNCIAEGVESIQHGEMLLRLGCEWGQGYAIGHPMPAHEFEQWLHTWQVPLSWKGFKPDSRSALPVPFTYADHRVWISQMIDYLSGKAQVPPQPEALQYWRDQSGRPTFFGKDPDDQVDVLHQSIQQLAHTLSEMKNAGRVEALRAGIDKLQHLQADLLGLLPPDQKPD